MRGLFGRFDDDDGGAGALGTGIITRAAYAAGVILERVDVLNTRGWALRRAEHLSQQTEHILQLLDTSAADHLEKQHEQGGSADSSGVVHGTLKGLLKHHQVAGALGDRGLACAVWAVDFVLSGRGAVVADWAVSALAAAISKAGYQVPAIEWCQKVHVDPLEHPSFVSSTWSKRCKEIHFSLVVKNSFWEAVEDPADPKNLKRSLSWLDSPRPAKRFPRDAPTAATARRSPRGAAAPRAAPPPRGHELRGEAPRHGPPPPGPAAGGAGALELHRPNDTVILRCVPRELSRDALVELLGTAGLAGRFNFVYMPMDFTLQQCIGYALVGLESRADGDLLIERLPEFEPAWSAPPATLEEHIERYRNSPVMHPKMPDAYKPAVFAGGHRVAFPEPTRPIRAPRIRHMKPPPREAWRVAPH